MKKKRQIYEENNEKQLKQPDKNAIISVISIFQVILKKTTNYLIKILNQIHIGNKSLQYNLHLQ